ncbi:DUF418 domain-containing protein [uncultured Aquimarina sp.]|uniref:DUF418 domain-containing protein n=1 Tax=uncultured Aquimarina sp. TaxID=575652 RepID=UPI002609D3CA|nr:DUF418 domain-containing protein [uncultured Aquimarina sp.]
MQNLTSNRILIIDALRGFALAGVCLVHMNEQYIASPPSENLMEVTNSIFDQILGGIISFFIIGKFFALFSILFGLSFFIQMDTAAKRGENFGTRFLWRAFLLLIIGFIHQLFYKGDILTIYAMLTPFLIPFYRLQKKWILLVAGLFLVSIPRFILYAILGNESAFGLPPIMDGNSTINIAYISTLKEGSIIEVFTANTGEGMLQKMDFQIGIFARLYLTFGYFLIGLWLGKIGLFHNVTEKIPLVRKWLKIASISFLIALAATAGIFALSPKPVDFKSWLHILAINTYDWSNIALTTIILLGFILLYQKKRGYKFLSLFSSYGRMALTNYVLQSIIGTFLLFGWGLGFLGQLQTIYLVIIAVVLISLQAIGSKIWLENFRYGPLEWLWRSATKGKIQALRK